MSLSSHQPPTATASACNTPLQLHQHTHSGRSNTHNDGPSSRAPGSDPNSAAAPETTVSAPPHAPTATAQGASRPSAPLLTDSPSPQIQKGGTDDCANPEGGPSDNSDGSDSRVTSSSSSSSSARTPPPHLPRRCVYLDPFAYSSSWPAFPSEPRGCAFFHPQHNTTNSIRRVPRLGILLSSGIIHTTTVLPPFPSININMSLRLVPTTPRVISPSPTPPDRSHRATSQDPQESYFGPVTRSVARRRSMTPQQDDRRDRRSRTRSRSPMETQSRAAVQPMTTVQEQQEHADAAAALPLPPGASEAASSDPFKTSLLAPPTTPGYWTWRDFSRSPSPLGLIPIHRHWRKFIHKHEVPRKALHVSIGFLAVWLYANGTQPDAVTPWLMRALIPIATVDYLRLNWPVFNRFYVRVLGAFMRETEYSGYNGVVFYLLGAWTVLFFLPKDVGMTAVLLLSWCDTAASTFGRLYGRYTPRLRRGKSLAGSLAAFLVGIATSAMFWGWLVPSTVSRIPSNDHVVPLMFHGSLGLPEAVSNYLGLTEEAATVTGAVALALMSVWSGFVASASEVVDIFGLDDNLTIPLLSGLGMWGFLKIFG